MALNEVIDLNATGNSDVLPALDVGYDGHDYIRVTPTSDPSNWSVSSQITFQPTTNSSMLYDLSESYISVQCAPYVTSSTNPGVKYYLSSLSCAGIDCTFSTSLVSSCDIMLGDKTIRSIEAPQAAYPYVGGVMSVLEASNYDTEGYAIPSAWPDTDEVQSTPAATIAGLNGSLDSQMYIIKDCTDPFNVCLNSSSVDFQYQAEGWPRKVSTQTEVTTPTGTAILTTPQYPDAISGNTYYRAEVIRRKNGSYNKVIAPATLPAAWTQTNI